MRFGSLTTTPDSRVQQVFVGLLVEGRQGVTGTGESTKAVSAATSRLGLCATGEG